MPQVTLIGLEEALNAIDFFGKAATEAANAAILEEAKYELPLTKAQVPVASGNLRASGRVEKYPQENGVVAAVIEYGGPAGSGGPDQTEDVDYAVYVHEDLEKVHPNGNAKFAENPVREEFASGRAVSRISATLLKFIGSYKGRKAVFIRGAGGRFTGSTGLD